MEIYHLEFKYKDAPEDEWGDICEHSFQDYAKALKSLADQIHDDEANEWLGDFEYRIRAVEVSPEK